jgi:DNA repair exonuclease SbcCD ATPase subunit
MIIFENIKWKNFLSTGNVYTKINLSKNKNTLIIGENGAGKSTILDALTFALYNKPFRKINKGQLVNSINNKGAVVELEFSLYKNKYRIVRGIKPNIFEVYKNNDLINQNADSKDYQEYLEKHILKIGYKSFCQVVVLGSATFLPFMQLPAAQRREIVETLLDLQIFTTMNSVLKDKVQKNKEDFIRVEEQKRNIEEKIIIIKKYIEKREQESKESVEKKEKEIEKIDEIIISKKEELKKVEKEYHELSQDVSDDKKITNENTNLLLLREKINSKIDMVSEEIKFLETNDDCPTCKQRIEESFKLESIGDKNDKLKEYKDGLFLLKEKIFNNEKEMQSLNESKEKLSKVKDQFRDISFDLSSTERMKKSIEAEIKSIKKKESTISNEEIKDSEEELIKINDIYNELIKNKDLYSASSVLLKDNGIKSRIIKKYIPIINKLINKYLSDLNFFVKFELDEEFNEVIKSRHRDEFSYSSFSEGERMKINLSILFTWRMISQLRNSINTNLLIMDEVFDSSLDSEATEDFMKLLNEFGDKTNVFIISHKTEQLNEKFDNIIRFKKQKNFSKIAQ